MYIKGSEYLSEFTGKQIDDAIRNQRDYASELALKADKSTTINDYPLSEDITLNAQDVGAMPADTQYGANLNFDSGNLGLVNQDGSVISEVYVYPNWRDIITSENMLPSDLVNDTGNVHKFITPEQLEQILLNKENIAQNSSAIEANTTSIATINSKIPSQATSENKLADKEFVNSSIATNTSYFIGTFNSVEELENYSGTLTNNDYAFVAITDSSGNTLYDRYKYNGSTSSWMFEYELNNSSFTANQWNTINSGITSSDVEQIATNATNIAQNTADIATKSSVTFVDWTV